MRNNALSAVDPDGRDLIYFDSNGNQVANAHKDKVVIDNDAGTLTVNGTTYNLADLHSEDVVHAAPTMFFEFSYSYRHMAGYIRDNIDEAALVPDPGEGTRG